MQPDVIVQMVDLREGDGKGPGRLNVAFLLVMTTEGGQGGFEGFRRCGGRAFLGV